MAPGPQVQAEFERLLKAEQAAAGAAPAPAAVPPPPAEPARGRRRSSPRAAAAASSAAAPSSSALTELFDARRRGPAPARAARGRAGDRQDPAGRAVHAGVRGRGRARAVRPLRRRDPHPLPAVRGGAAPATSRAPRSTGSRRGAPSSAASSPSCSPTGEAAGPEATDRYRLFDAAADVLTDIARAQPVVLVLDDLHWADKPTLLMLRQLVRAADESPLLIVASFRDTERPEVADGHRSCSSAASTTTRRSRCAGSTRPTPSELIGEFGSEVPEHVNRTLWEEHEGQPVLPRGDGPPSRVGRPPDGNGAPWPVELPEGIREVIGRRLATLSDDARDVLTTAAVVGREFRIELLEELGSYDEDKLDDGRRRERRRPRDCRGPRRLRALQLQPQPDPPDALRRADRARVAAACTCAWPRRSSGSSRRRRRELAHHFSLSPPTRGAAKAVEYARAGRARRVGAARLRGGGAAVRGRAARARAVGRRRRAAAAGCCSPAATRRPRPAIDRRAGDVPRRRRRRPARSARPSCSRRRRSATARRARWRAAWSTRPWCD